MFKYIRFETWAGAGGRGPDRPFPGAGSSHPRGRKTAGGQRPPRLERGEGERGRGVCGPGRTLPPEGPRALTGRPPSKAPRARGPEKPAPRPSGTALAAPRPSPYRSPVAAVPELPAAHLPQAVPGLSLRRRRLLRPGAPPQLPLRARPLPPMIGCQVSAPAS